MAPAVTPTFVVTRSSATASRITRGTLVYRPALVRACSCSTAAPGTEINPSRALAGASGSHLPRDRHTGYAGYVLEAHDQVGGVGGGGCKVVPARYLVPHAPAFEVEVKHYSTMKEIIQDRHAGLAPGGRIFGGAIIEYKPRARRAAAAAAPPPELVEEDAEDVWEPALSSTDDEAHVQDAPPAPAEEPPRGRKRAAVESEPGGGDKQRGEGSAGQEMDFGPPL